MLGQYHNLQEQEGCAQDRVEGTHKMKEKQIPHNDIQHNSDNTTYKHSTTTSQLAEPHTKLLTAWIYYPKHIICCFVLILVRK